MYGHHERLTREELYELVWTVPASTLCERFGMSGRGLAKLCERHFIPVPERGWWAKKAAGQDVARQPLRPVKEAYLQTIELYVREDWRQWLTDEERAMFEERLAADASASASVPEADDSRHPLIVRARRKHPDPSAPRFETTVSDALRERALRLAAGLVNACESRGYRFERRPNAAEGAAAVNVFGHLVGLAIEEPPRRVPHVLTKKEEREKAVGRGWNIPEYDTVPSGELVILLHHDADGERRSFAATKEREIEAVLPEVMKALLKIAMRLRAHQNYVEERARREHEAAEQRRQEEQRRREEEARIAAERRSARELLRDATRLRQTRDVMQLVAAVEELLRTEPVDEAALEEWRAFATGVAETLNPLRRIVKPLLKVERRS